MFGSFSESALLAYAEKLKKVVAMQGTERHTNFGISDEDSSYLDTGESQDADDYAELYDFTTCIRSKTPCKGSPGAKSAVRDRKPIQQPRIPSRQHDWKQRC
jgi:hypothetical protein